MLVRHYGNVVSYLIFFEYNFLQVGCRQAGPPIRLLVGMEFLRDLDRLRIGG